MTKRRTKSAPKSALERATFEDLVEALGRRIVAECPDDWQMIVCESLSRATDEEASRFQWHEMLHYERANAMMSVLMTYDLELIKLVDEVLMAFGLDDAPEGPSPEEVFTLVMRFAEHGMHRANCHEEGREWVRAHPASPETMRHLERRRNYAKERDRRMRELERELRREDAEKAAQQEGKVLYIGA